MLERFLNHIKTFNLEPINVPIMLAVSGGIDSVCMTHLFHEANIPFAIAHCNFGLRAEESDGDQAFIEELASNYHCALHIKHFNTKKYSAVHGISIQMAARDLRYTWFEELALENGYQHIAVAHNLNDSTETMLLNLVRGTGIKGLTGISAQKGRIIRPLLFAERNAIQAYVNKHQLAYREDSSNAETKYYRNLIRHEIIPRLEKINPALQDTFRQEAEIFNATHSIYKEQVEKLREQICTPLRNGMELSIDALHKLRVTPPVLFEILEPYGFSYSDVKNIFNASQSETGKQFFSEGYQLVKDREAFVLAPREPMKLHVSYPISESTTQLTTPIQLTIKYINCTPSFILPGSPYEVALDRDQLCFPLELRHWRKGDSFKPLGMKGHKKLSDFFTDRKINRIEKDRIWLLTSNNTIVWVLGHQIDDRYKITSHTKNIMVLQLKH